MNKDEYIGKLEDKIEDLKRWNKLLEDLVEEQLEETEEIKQENEDICKERIFNIYDVAKFVDRICKENYDCSSCIFRTETFDCMHMKSKIDAIIDEEEMLKCIKIIEKWKLEHENKNIKQIK